jgi:hypothetical protein
VQGPAGRSRRVQKNGPHNLSTFEKIVRLNLIGTFNVASAAASEQVLKNRGETIYVSVE